MKILKLQANEILGIYAKLPRKDISYRLKQIHPKYLQNIKDNEFAERYSFTFLDNKLYLSDHVMTKGLKVIYTEVKEKIFKR